MLGELWRFIKVSFNRRMYLYAIGVISGTLFGSFPNLLVRFLCLGIFITAFALLTPFLTSLVAWQIKAFFSRKYDADQRIKNEVNKVAELLGVKVKKVLIAKGLCNAYVVFGTLVLGEELLERLGPSQRRAVFAHELGHLKEKHVWLRMLAAVATPTLPLWAWQRLYFPVIINEYFTQLMLSIMISLILFAFSVVAMVPLNWQLEIRADRFMVDVVGKASAISALLAITTREKFKEPSEDHPSVSERIKIILNYASRKRAARTNPEKHDQT
jgi:STE24 endopeptidase